MFRCAFCGVSISKYQKMCSTCQAQQDAEIFAHNQAYERKQQEKRRRLQEEQEKEIARKTHAFYHRECPVCAEEVKRKAMKCIHCSHEFDDYEEQRAFVKQREQEKEEFGCELWEGKEEFLKRKELEDMEKLKKIEARKKERQMALIKQRDKIWNNALRRGTGQESEQLRKRREFRKKWNPVVIWFLQWIGCTTFVYMILFIFIISVWPKNNPPEVILFPLLILSLWPPFIFSKKIKDFFTAMAYKE